MITQSLYENPLDVYRDKMLQRRKASEALNEEEFDLNNAGTKRSIEGYGLKANEITARQNYEDTKYLNDPLMVSRRRGLEDSMMKVREGILNRMKSRF